MLAYQMPVVPNEVPKTNIEDKFNKLIEIARSEGINVIDLDFNGEITGLLSRVNKKSFLAIDYSQKYYRHAIEALIFLISIHLGRVDIEPSKIIDGYPTWIC